MKKVKRFNILQYVIPFFLISLVACDTDETSGEPIIYEGIVQEKHFQKGDVNVGVGVGSNGSIAVTPVVSSDKYIIFVDGKDYEVSEKVWLSVEKDDHIEYEKGVFGGIRNIKVLYEEETN
ncbi:MULTISPECIES: hypothetical protein [Siminovitchia]|uniref:DUF3221 domain-containing protein n=1 Tax=Siminovitchia sediminis TaxID=1274353 RepID=A0ABW4KMU1_9BACI|nr:hypothetical protein [Siminovitchia fortis]